MYYMRARIIRLVNHDAIDQFQVAAILGLPVAEVAKTLATPGYEPPDPVEVAIETALAGVGGVVQVFAFPTPSSEWVCEHNLGRDPIVSAFDLSGNLRPFIPSMNSEDLNTLTLSPNPPLAGKVVIE